MVGHQSRQQPFFPRVASHYQLCLGFCGTGHSSPSWLVGNSLGCFVLHHLVCWPDLHDRHGAAICHHVPQNHSTWPGAGISTMQNCQALHHDMVLLGILTWISQVFGTSDPSWVHLSSGVANVSIKIDCFLLFNPFPRTFWPWSLWTLLDFYPVQIGWKTCAASKWFVYCASWNWCGCWEAPNSRTETCCNTTFKPCKAVNTLSIHRYMLPYVFVCFVQSLNSLVQAEELRFLYLYLTNSLRCYVSCWFWFWLAIGWLVFGLWHWSWWMKSTLSGSTKSRRQIYLMAFALESPLSAAQRVDWGRKLFWSEEVNTMWNWMWHVQHDLDMPTTRILDVYALLSFRIFLN